MPRPTLDGRPLDRTAEAARLAPLAAAGLSIAEAARLLGLTRNAVTGRARDCGVRFQGAPRPGPGCTPAQARAGWATRRARGWTATPRPAGHVCHVNTRGLSHG